MKKLENIVRKSDLMEINIKYGRDTINFNLYEELVIDEDFIQRELEKQPANYSYLSVLYAHLVRKYEDEQAKFQRKEAELYIKYKTTEKSKYFALTGRPPDKDTTKYYVEQDRSYLVALKTLNKAKFNMLLIKAALNSFEQRKDMLQTLSANRRREQ